MFTPEFLKRRGVDSPLRIRCLQNRRVLGMGDGDRYELAVGRVEIPQDEDHPGRARVVLDRTGQGCGYS